MIARRGHTDSQFEQELQQLRQLLLLMSGEIERNIGEAIRAILEVRADLAREVIQRDHRVNCLELEVDDLCLRVLALRQPAASDLRLITTTLKIVTDLERIGDLAANMAERAILLAEQPRLEQRAAVSEMGDLALAMLRGALDALVHREPALAEQVIAQDQALDDLNRAMFQGLVALMQSAPELVPGALNLMSASKHLERIGDHATNIAEMVVFMLRGKDIRHQWSRKEQNHR